MRILDKLPFAIILIFLAAACGPLRTPTPLPPPTQPPAVKSPAAAGPSEGATQVSPNNPAPAQSGGAQAPVGNPVSLQVLSPQDGAVVNAAQVQVNGLASPGNVVTVNNDILIVGADGRFQSTVSLDEGPNLIEVIASDDAGNEIPVDLTVTYEP